MLFVGNRVGALICRKSYFVLESSIGALFFEVASFQKPNRQAMELEALIHQARVEPQPGMNPAGIQC